MMWDNEKLGQIWQKIAWLRPCKSGANLFIFENGGGRLLEAVLNRVNAMIDSNIILEKTGMTHPL